MTAAVAAVTCVVHKHGIGAGFIKINEREQASGSVRHFSSCVWGHLTLFSWLMMVGVYVGGGFAGDDCYI